MLFNLNNIKQKLLIKYPDYGSVIANCSFIPTPTIKTAKTDGQDIYYSLTFMNSLTEAEQVAALAHEIGHIIFQHIPKLEGKDPKTWNIAADAVINSQLQKDNLSLHKGAIFIPNAINYTAEELYNKLIKLKNQTSQLSNHLNSPQSPSANSQPTKFESPSDFSFEDVKKYYDQDIESHHSWLEDFKKKTTSSLSPESSLPEADNLTSENQDPSSTSVRQDIARISKLGEPQAYHHNRITYKKMLEELRKTILNGITHGHTTNSQTLEVNDIGNSSSLIDWRRYLRETIKFNLEWSYKHATIEDGVVTPHLERLPQPETEILLDTSGSVSSDLLKNFLRECKHLIHNSKVKAGCFDTQFYGFQTLKNADDIDSMIFTGRGGTDFNIAVNAFTRSCINKIIFTDGKAPMPTKKENIIWVVFGYQKISPPGGKVIYIDEEQLNKLTATAVVKKRGRY